MCKLWVCQHGGSSSSQRKQPEPYLLGNLCGLETGREHTGTRVLANVQKICNRTCWVGSDDLWAEKGITSSLQ